MTERYISVTDDEYVYFLDTQSEDYKTLEDFEKIEFEEAQKDNVDIKEYEDAILQSANDNYWDWVYDYHIETDTVNDLLNNQEEEIQELETRNKRQYNLLTKISDLMMARDWKGLEKIVEDWEESDRLLQAEWGNCGDVE